MLKIIFWEIEEVELNCEHTDSVQRAQVVF